MKKLLSILLAVMLLATLAVTAFAADEETFDTWDGSATTPTKSGDTYQIDSAEDFIGFANLVNGGESHANALLLIGIDLNNTAFTPIGDYDDPYIGTFDGNGHTIKNATITGNENQILAGLFGCVSEGFVLSDFKTHVGHIKNLVLDNIDVTNSSEASSGQDNEQAASGTAVGALISGTTIENVSTTATCSVSGVYRTGGIVGSSKDSGTTIKNCTNRAAVTGERNYTGGIVGAAHNVATNTGTTIDGCVNEGTVNGTTEVGGIVGYTDQSVVKNCTNNGSVTGSGNYGTGGIVGCDIMNTLLGIFPRDGSTIDNCINNGAVSSPRAGGILGSYVAAPGDDPPTSDIVSTITNCKNFGAISSPNGNGVCGAIYGAPIAYKTGETGVEHMITVINGCTVGGTVEGAGVPTDDEQFEHFISPSDCVELGTNTRAVEA